MLSVLRRHILFATVISVGGAIALFAFILATANMLKDLLTYALDGRLPGLLFLQLSGLLFPFVITYALPMGMLLGVLLVLGRFSADHEIVAMRASGLSIMRICRPILWLALFGFLLELAINFEIMPRARTHYHQVLDRTIRSTALDFVKPQTFLRGLFRDKIVYIGEKDGNILRNFWLWELDERSRVVRVWHAEEAIPQFNAAEASMELVLNRAKLENRDARDPEAMEEPPVIGTFGTTRVRFSLEHALGKSQVRRKMDWMTLRQLLDERQRLAEINAPVLDRLKVDLTLHQKCTTAVAVFAFTLVGIPLGIKTQRKETAANLGIAVGLVLSYYFLSIAVGWLDRYPDLRPDLLLWLPNVIFITLGIWLLRRVDRV